MESAAASSRSRDSRIGIARSPADSDELLPIPKGSVRIVRNPFDVAGFLGTPKHPVGFTKAPKYPRGHLRAPVIHRKRSYCGRLSRIPKDSPGTRDPKDSQWTLKAPRDYVAVP